MYKQQNKKLKSFKYKLFKMLYLCILKLLDVDNKKNKINSFFKKDIKLALTNTKGHIKLGCNQNEIAGFSLYMMF